MTFTLQPVQVGNGSDEEGMLVFDDTRRLLAVLTHLGEQYDDVSGHWYLEAGLVGWMVSGPPLPLWTPLRIGSASASPVELDRG